MPETASLRQLEGFSLTTGEILYRLRVEWRRGFPFSC